MKLIKLLGEAGVVGCVCVCPFAHLNTNLQGGGSLLMIVLRLSLWFLVEFVLLWHDICTADVLC